MTFETRAQTSGDHGRAAQAGWHGFAVTRNRPEAAAGIAVAPTPIASGWAMTLSGVAMPVWATFARRLSGLAEDAVTVDRSASGLPSLEIHEESDCLQGEHCFAALIDGRLFAALIVKPEPRFAGQDWLVARLATPLDPAERFRLFSGRPGGSMTPRGVPVCVCCDVRLSQIADAIRAGCKSVDAVGAATRAGTNCGRCRPHIAELIARGGCMEAWPQPSL